MNFSKKVYQCQQLIDGQSIWMKCENFPISPLILSDPYAKKVDRDHLNVTIVYGFGVIIIEIRNELMIRLSRARFFPTSNKRNAEHSGINNFIKNTRDRQQMHFAAFVEVHKSFRLFLKKYI